MNWARSRASVTIMVETTMEAISEADQAETLAAETTTEAISEAGRVGTLEEEIMMVEVLEEDQAEILAVVEVEILAAAAILEAVAASSK
jgi:hypothetical protein